MEDPDSTAKKRTLPQWMIDLDNDGKSTKATKVSKKKKSVIRSPIKQTVYCMNEKELVEVALEFMSKSYYENDIGVKLETDSCSPVTPSEALDISQRSDNDSALDDRDDSPSSPSVAFHQNSGRREFMEEDDDPMKFVREIFFS